MNWKKNGNFWFLGAFLGVTGLLSAAVLGLTNGLVAPRIAAAEEQAKTALFGELIPVFNNRPAEEKVQIDGVTIYPARKNGTLTGVIAEASGSGYGGKLTILVGISNLGFIQQILVTDDKETPGLGKKCTERKFQKTIKNFWKATPAGLPPNKFLDKFKGKSRQTVTDWRVKKDGGTISYVSGATVTSRAIAKLADQSTEAARKFIIQEKINAERGAEK